ncbi:MAG TPA: cytochrome c biogenesis protein CcdA [Blastocatellia bacterium]|nr:cytochrome c biogenesis protein CcdA [Blastocatellia bacterium]
MYFRRQLGKSLITLAAAAVCLLAAANAPAQGLNPVTLTARLDPDQVKPGQGAKLLITAKIDPKWHLYSLTQPAGGPKPTQITLEEGGVFKLDGTPRQPKPKVAADPNFSQPGEPPFMTETFETEAVFTVPLKAADDAPLGPQKVIVKFRFQACDDHQCLPPRTKPIEVEATIIAANAKASKPVANQIAGPIVGPIAGPNSTASPVPSPSAAATVVPTATPVPVETPTPAPVGATASIQTPGGGQSATAFNEDPTANLKERGLLGYILFAMGVGFLSLLTPCVFPMIPITVSFFTKSQEQQGSKPVTQALIYCFGIIFTFTGLGLALTLIAGPSGINKVAASPWMNLFLTSLFAVFALNLFGMFEIRLPSGLISKLDSRSNSGTIAATLLMGLTFTLTSFTCTAAFVGTVLVAVTQGNWFWPAIGMLAFSTAFASPFFLLALFPKWLKSMPKSGGWLNSVKVVMGFLELGAAFKFLSNVDLVWEWNTVSRNVVLAAWIAIALITTIYLLGKFQLPHDSPTTRIGVSRMLIATFFLGLAFYFLTGLFGANLGEWEAMLPPAQANLSSSPVSGSPHAAWLPSYDAALQKARAENKPVFLNFTGVTCTNCRWMESNMFTDQRVRKELERFVLAELYTDRETADDERNSQLQAEKFETVALPLYAIVNPDGKTLAKFPGLTRDKQEFIGFLQLGANRFQPINALKTALN